MRLSPSQGNLPPGADLRPFFFAHADRTDCVNSTLTPAVIEKRVQVRHEVSDPVQVRRILRLAALSSRGRNVTIRLHESPA